MKKIDYIPLNLVPGSDPVKMCKYDATVWRIVDVHYDGLTYYVLESDAGRKIELPNFFRVYWSPEGF